jgi:hypothetical protein
MAWRERLRCLVAAAAGDRVPSLSPESLASVVEDGASPPEHRVAAALARARVEDPGVRRRVDAALATCADDALRAALEAAGRRRDRRGGPGPRGAPAGVTLSAP